MSSRSRSRSWTLFVDDERLQDDPGEASRCYWEPLFFAGEVTAELVHSDGRSAALFLLDVSPDPAKIGRDVFAEMVSELWRADPSLVLGCEPATNPIGATGTFDDPWLAFARLRRYAPGVLASDRSDPQLGRDVR